MTFPFCFIPNGSRFALRLRRCVTDERVSPLNEILHVRCVGMAAIMLSPCELPGQETLIHWRHFRCVIIPLHVKPFGAKQHKHPARVHGRHKASLMIEPVSVALLRNSVADEVEARRAASNQFVGIYWNISRRLAAKSSLG